LQRWIGWTTGSEAGNLAANIQKREAAMIIKKIINPDRIRKIKGGFSFIPHRFITDGFLASLSQTELLLYLFLVLVSDRNGLSYYAYDSICSLLRLTLDDYIQARNGLLKMDLIAFDGIVYQVLELPAKAPDAAKQNHSKNLSRLINKVVKKV
jgi:hypothetical protein